MDFNFDLKKLTDWVMELFAKKAKSTAQDISESMTSFAGFLKALGISSPHLDSAEQLAPALVAQVDRLTIEARNSAPDLVAQAAAAAKAAAAGTQVALAPPANPTAPTGPKPAASTERAPV